MVVRQGPIPEEQTATKWPSGCTLGSDSRRSILQDLKLEKILQSKMDGPCLLGPSLSTYAGRSKINRDVPTSTGHDQNPCCIGTENQKESTNEGKYLEVYGRFQYNEKASFGTEKPYMITQRLREKESK